MRLELSAEHDAVQLHTQYRQRDRLQIRDVLTEPSAEAILAELQRLPWGAAFNTDEGVVELDATQVAGLSPRQVQQMLAQVQVRAQTKFQFLYSYYPLFAAYFRPQRQDMAIFRAYEFINSPAVLDFVRIVTGLSTIRWADAQATLFRAGDFLKYHTDAAAGNHRLAAYVLNLTKGWGRDWGGYLQFFDERYDVEQAYRPVFNALNIFTVPADHSVSMVSTYAPGSRYSITGWFREDDRPGPIGR